MKKPKSPRLDATVRRIEVREFLEDLLLRGVRDIRRVVIELPLYDVTITPRPVVEVEDV